jgi:pyruvate dehydrogenase E1 component
MEECVDGEYQNFKAKDGAYVREHFFGKYPELKNMVSNLSDEDVWRLNRGGHDPHKVYAAYDAAVKHTGQPTVILAKTVKGYGMGEAGEGQNITHQQKKMGEHALKAFRDRFDIPISDDEIADAPFYRPPQDSPEIKYMHERRQALGGFLPARRTHVEPLAVPELSAFESQLKDSGKREISTTMAFVRILTTLVGMEGLFRQLGIYSMKGQLYEPEDADQLMYYREDKKGQILQEGINEAGAVSSWIAAGTAYSNHGISMIPFYIFYSMFGFQRIGDFAGRTTLAGEGLQHDDGHSHLFSANIPNCVSYDPTFGYELAVIIQDGLRRMYHDREAVFYYITVMNENYHQPAIPDDAREGILKGMYCLRDGAGSGRSKKKPSVQLMGCGSILREVLAAADLLEEDFGVSATVWSTPSFTELQREGTDTARWNMLHPGEKPRQSYVAKCLSSHEGPVVAASDYVQMFANQIRTFIDRRYVALGTDGYGRSDTRKNLRRFFEVDRHYVTVAALHALADDGDVPRSKVADAIKKYGIDADKPNPLTV